MWHGRKKSLSFRFHEILRQAQDDRVFGLRPKRKLIQSVPIHGFAYSKTEHEPQWRRANKRRAYVTHKPILQRLQLVAIVCLLVFVFLFPTRQKLRFHLSYSRTSSLVFDVREPLCVKYENAWRFVA